MLATLTLEREPPKYLDGPAMLESWLLAVGLLSGLGLAIWLLVRLLQGPGPVRDESHWSWGKRLVVIVILGVLGAMLPNAMRLLWYSLGLADLTVGPGGKTIGTLTASERLALLIPRNLFLILAACAVAAVLLPLLLHLSHLSGRRIWALAKLSFKEGVRRRILWIFALLPVVFLFAAWFITTKPEDQLRSYVGTVYLVMTILTLVTAGLVASFSLPADLRNQTIHTIVTKPVQRFEILLGRFLGYTALLTIALIGMTLLSLVYVARGIQIDPDAAEESYKARVPIYGNILIQGGKNVGYEWEYRKYISGDTKEDYAQWTFPTLSRDLGDRGDLGMVTCEFTFDIFRTTKGVENEGVFCSFMFENWQSVPGSAPGVPEQQDQYRREKNDLTLLLTPERETERNRLLQLASGNPPAQEVQAATERYLAEKYGPRTEEAQQLRARLLRLVADMKPDDRQKNIPLAIANYLAEKYHFYEILSKEVVDFHTQAVEIPAGLFRNLKSWNLSNGPPLKVVVHCESRTQYVGFAKADLYLMDQVRDFKQNFFKGAVGLWYRMCLVIGVAVTCSTYLSGVISLLATMFLLLLGLCKDYIHQVAWHLVQGGGPVESFYRLARHQHVAIPLDPNPVATVIQNLDKTNEWLFQEMEQFIPDVNQFNLTHFVAEGFDISGEGLIMTGVVLAAYLLPWLVLSFYLMRSREVAS